MPKKQVTCTEVVEQGAAFSVALSGSPEHFRSFDFSDMLFFIKRFRRPMRGKLVDIKETGKINISFLIFQIVKV
jgi:hypothetical protein